MTAYVDARLGCCIMPNKGPKNNKFHGYVDNKNVSVAAYKGVMPLSFFLSSTSVV